MARLRLTHLTFIGSTVEPATVEFGPSMTLICGPSDTGKSFIVDAIDFMLGANSLKEIPERDGYSTVLLGMALPEGEHITLSRGVNGGGFGLYLEEVRSGPLPVADENLGPKHSATSETNISRFLLAHVGQDGKRVRKNVRNETVSLSFRHLAHLCVVDETQMQAETSPALTGSYVSKTTEISVLKLLLQDEDDSALVSTKSSSEAARLSGAKVEVLDELIASLRAQLDEAPLQSDLAAQLERLTAEIDDRSQSLQAASRLRDQLIDARSRLQDQLALDERQHAEGRALTSRFGLLLNQYDSDLARLELLREAGAILGYFTPGTCAFCGAEPESQHLNDLCDVDETYFEASVDAEHLKTASLREDLVATLEVVMADQRSLEEGIEGARTEVQEFVNRIALVDEQLRPTRSDLSELLNLRREVEGTLAVYSQIVELEDRKARIAAASTTETAAAVSGLNLAALAEFSGEIGQRLDAWGFPEGIDVRYDRNEQDLVAGDQLRSAHGKGVRSILHAAFTLGLGQYCFDREIAHPGFVVLDSPLVTYRPPDHADHEDLDGEDAIDARIVAAFYADVQGNYDGQVIVMENTDPPEPLDGESVDIRFTKVDGIGRYGFFPMGGRLAK